MQFIPMIFTAMGSGATAIGATAIGSGLTSFGGTIAGALGTAGSGSLFGSILQGATGLVGAMSAMRAGQAQAIQYGVASEETKMEAAEEGLQGRVRRDSMRRDLIKQLGTQDVAAAASGIDLSFGTPLSARDSAQRDAGSALALDQSNQDARQGALMRKAAAYRKAAAEAGRAGGEKAWGLLLETGADMANRA